MRSALSLSDVSVSSICGLSEQNLFVQPGIEIGLINTLGLQSYTPVDNTRVQTLRFTQVYWFLYTVFQHILDTISSVRQQLVHIIHIAYKKEHELRKGKK